jgi:hypothetical protein
MGSVPGYHMIRKFYILILPYYVGEGSNADRLGYPNRAYTIGKNRKLVRTR